MRHGPRNCQWNEIQGKKGDWSNTKRISTEIINRKFSVCCLQWKLVCLECHNSNISGTIQKLFWRRESIIVGDHKRQRPTVQNELPTKDMLITIRFCKKKRTWPLAVLLTKCRYYSLFQNHQINHLRKLKYGRLFVLNKQTKQQTIIQFINAHTQLFKIAYSLRGK